MMFPRELYYIRSEDKSWCLIFRDNNDDYDDDDDDDDDDEDDDVDDDATIIMMSMSLIDFTGLKRLLKNDLIFRKKSSECDLDRRNTGIEHQSVRDEAVNHQGDTN
ncbi:hypothetical protein HZH66_011215 [Vespula vulgaris]|uniref:Uncharacterized protein n=1 Tax=Vespula vulgaris TaxID=7454 RepID=A0A834MXJ1_VESVU|nr:hypothetical protein HZH66_011215 [Vespula vulgaris]